MLGFFSAQLCVCGIIIIIIIIISYEHNNCNKWSFLFLGFRRVLNVMCSFLGNSPASEF